MKSLIGNDTSSPVSTDNDELTSIHKVLAWYTEKEQDIPEKLITSVIELTEKIES